MKKGFTLIELLAVILILGIIALIAIPQVTNVIDNASKGAAETSAEHYVGAVNTTIGLNKLNGNAVNNISEGVNDVSGIEVNISGEGPANGIVYVENGQVQMADLEVNGYSVLCNKKGKCEATKGTFKYFSGKADPIPTNINEYESNRSGDKNVYFKYPLENNSLGKGQLCIFDGDKEVCLETGKYQESETKIFEYFGFDQNSWSYNSTYGAYFKTAGKFDIWCQWQENDNAKCNNGIFEVSANSSGWIGMIDQKNSTSYGLYEDGYAYSY